MQMDNGLGYPIKSTGVIGMYIQQTGTYEDQFRRPYNTVLDGNTFNKIIERSSNIGLVEKHAIVDFANDIVRPQATPESSKPISIANGWSTERLRFLLHITSKNSLGQTVDEHIVGYTDHPGVSMNGNLDPNMVFYINAINTTIRAQQNTPMGRMAYTNLIDSSHLIYNNEYNGLSDRSNMMYGLRPEDIYANMENDALRFGLTEGSSFHDSRYYITQATIKSKRENAIVPLYTTNLINNYIQSAHIAENPTEVLEHARSNSFARDIANDNFLNFIRQKSNMNSCSSFTLRDLMSFDQNVFNVINFIDKRHPLYDDDTHTRGRGRDWYGSDSTTLFATTLSQSLPSYMLQYGLTKVSFRSHNSNMGGMIQTIFQEIHGFNQEYNLGPKAEKLKIHLETELLKSLSYNSQIMFFIEVNINLIGETKIIISLNGEPNSLFITPSFSDALLSPIVTTVDETATNIATDFNNIVSHLRLKVDSNHYGLVDDYTNFYNPNEYDNDNNQQPNMMSFSQSNYDPII